MALSGQSIWLSGRWNGSSRRSKQLSEVYKRLPGRCRGCLEATIDDRGNQRTPKIASETSQKEPRRACRASGRSWRVLNNEKPHKHRVFSSFERPEMKPVLAWEREARFSVKAFLPSEVLAISRMISIFKNNSKHTMWSSAAPTARP